MKKQLEEPLEGALTQSMDIGTKGFDDFQAIVLKKARKRDENQKLRINLLMLKYQMEGYLTSGTTEEKTVGEFLKTILKTLQIQQNQFAEYIGLKPSNLSKLISGERTINYDLALIFGRLFNHNAMLWIEIQAKNELDKLRNTESNKYAVYSLNDLVKEHKSAV
jgi:addiction module HigA family antidote